MQVRPAAILGFLLLAAGCGSSVMEYQPQTYTKDLSPKETIERVILSQPGTNAPMSVTITDEYIKVFTRRTRRGPAMGTVHGGVVIVGPQTEYAAAPITIYYQYVGDMKLYKRRDYFVVMIYDRGGGYQYRVITYMLGEAKSFIDALNFIVSDFNNKTK